MRSSMKFTIRRAVPLSSLLRPRLAVSVYLIVHAKILPHVRSFMHLLLALADPLEHVRSQVVVLNVIQTPVDYLSQVEGLGSPGQ